MEIPHDLFSTLSAKVLRKNSKYYTAAIVTQLKLTDSENGVIQNADRYYNYVLRQHGFLYEPTCNGYRIIDKRHGVIAIKFNENFESSDIYNSVFVNLPKDEFCFTVSYIIAKHADQLYSNIALTCHKSSDESLSSLISEAKTLVESSQNVLSLAKSFSSKDSKEMKDKLKDIQICHGRLSRIVKLINVSLHG